MDRQLYRLTEAAEILGIGRSRIYVEVAAGRLGVVRIGKAVRVPADELRAYVERAKAEAGLAPVA
jgi:excisionase family DNA binding protein